MNEYWRKHPPVHLLLAAYMGYDPEKAAKNRMEQRAELIGAVLAAGGDILPPPEEKRAC